MSGRTRKTNSVVPDSSKKWKTERFVDELKQLGIVAHKSWTFDMLSQIYHAPCLPCINVDRLEFELQFHPDKEFVRYLINGLREGFDTLVSDIDLPTMECKILCSALADPQSFACPVKHTSF